MLRTILVVLTLGAHHPTPRPHWNGSSWSCPVHYSVYAVESRALAGKKDFVVCVKEKLIPAVRINGTSDIADIPNMLAAEFPDVQFYDYTKIPKPYLRVRSNYHLTFSMHENNQASAIDALKHGVNVAVVFDVKKGKPLPETFLGASVVDGDAHDLRFLNGYKGAVIGLRAKGQAKQDASGFVQISARI